METSDLQLTKNEERMPVKIIGIDPGSNITGYGIIEISGSSHKAISWGCFRLKRKTLADRLLQLHEELSEIIQIFQPNEAAIESVFMSKYPDAALKLGHARGTAMVTMAKHGLKVAEYAPRQIKQSVACYGAAGKDQVSTMVMRLLGIKEKPIYDATDALAISICHAHMRSSKLLAAK